MNPPSRKSPLPALLILTAALLTAPGCGKKADTNKNQASLQDLNRALAVVMMHDGQQIPTTNEVAALLAQTGKVFPTVPPGKKLILDPVTRKFELLDQ